MSVDVMSRAFAMLALLTVAATAAVVVLALLARSPRASEFARLRDDVASSALWLGWIVALVTSLGSLYYSLVAHYEPCELCWYQRICVYPLSAVLLVAAVKRFYGIWRYALPQVVIGIVIAIYHTQLQAYPKQHSFCSVTVPCTARYVWEFGFVSLPLMDLAALAFVFAMLLLARSVEVRTGEPAASEARSGDVLPAERRGGS